MAKPGLAKFGRTLGPHPSGPTLRGRTLPGPHLFLVWAPTLRGPELGPTVAAETGLTQFGPNCKVHRIFSGLSRIKADWPKSNWPKSNWPNSNRPNSDKPVSLSRIGLNRAPPKFLGVGATLMRFTWANISEQRRIFVSNFGMTCNSLCEFHMLDRLRHVSALPENGLRRRHVLKYATQLSCIRRLTFKRLLSQFLITPLIRFP